MSSNTASLINYHSRELSKKSDYSDIIHAQRPIAPHPMELAARAAQFSPYAALVGHKDIITSDEERAEETLDHEHEIIFDKTT